MPVETTQEMNRKMVKAKKRVMWAEKEPFEGVARSMYQEPTEVCLVGMQRQLDSLEQQEQELMSVDESNGSPTSELAG